jgi:hypothetical protein
MNALKILGIISFLILVMHILVLIQFIPYDMVWAGKLHSVEEMQRFEIVSILANLLLMTTLWIKYRQIILKHEGKFIRYVLWTFVMVFVMNTLGNLFAKSLFEKYVFTAVTAICAFLTYRIVKPVNYKA